MHFDYCEFDRQVLYITNMYVDMYIYESDWFGKILGNSILFRLYEHNNAQWGCWHLAQAKCQKCATHRIANSYKHNQHTRVQIHLHIKRFTHM